MPKMLSSLYIREYLSCQPVWIYLTLFIDCRVFHIINIAIYLMIPNTGQLLTCFFFTAIHDMATVLSPVSLYTEVSMSVR